MVGTSKFERRYFDISNNVHPVERTSTKRGKSVYVATERVATCTHKKIQHTFMEENNVNISIGTISSLKPFFITNPTDKEKVLCMCKLCLNTRLKFEALMDHSKKNGGPFSDSISEYLMTSCKCGKNKNGYWARQCCLDECKSCHIKTIIPLPNLDSEVIL